MKYCTDCGTKLEDGARFCSHCGKSCAGADPRRAPVSSSTCVEHDKTRRGSSGGIGKFFAGTFLGAFLGRLFGGDSHASASSTGDSAQERYHESFVRDADDDDDRYEDDYEENDFFDDDDDERDDYDDDAYDDHDEYDEYDDGDYDDDDYGDD